jgi:hypothetical protein
MASSSAPVLTIAQIVQGLGSLETEHWKLTKSWVLLKLSEEAKHKNLLQYVQSQLDLIPQRPLMCSYKHLGY